ncbi:MAG: hypothetical protein AAFX56_08250 [Pseudomonadota bacterium]
MLRKNRLLSISLLTIVFALAGCGGLSITSEENGEVKSGYPVYAPMLVVNIEPKQVCVEPDKDGKCGAGGKKEPRCVMSAPYLLPDYKEEFIVDFEKGLGSYSGSFEIKDGWMLASATSAADPSAFLSAAAEIMALDGGNECIPGIYRISSSKDSIELKRLYTWNFVVTPGPGGRE